MVFKVRATAQFMTTKSSVVGVILFVSVALSSPMVVAHEGPDPLSHWYLQNEYIKDNVLSARLGPDGVFSAEPKFAMDATGEAVLFSGRTPHCVIAMDHNKAKKFLPTRAMTVAAWVSVDSGKEWGGIIGVVLDNGDVEQGWVLGYDNQHFTFGLSTTGSDDGNGLMTYFKSTTKFELGKFYHVVAVYDGKITEIYVNGKKESSGTEQSGDIFYPTKTPYVIGAYADSNELTVHHGRIREVKVYDLAAKAEWVAEAFSHHKQLAQEPAVVQPQPLEAYVSPYLQWATKNSMTVMWETNEISTSVVHYGETSACAQSFSAVDAKIHEVKIPNLKTQTQYFYRVESVTAAKEKYQSKVSTFQTAVHADSPFAFAVISDTQGNPAVSSVLANMAWDQRPNFLLHPGDLVSTGKNKDHWLNHFFPGMRPLIDRVAFFPVLGNHEQNADHYYNYVSLPEPEYYYTFQYGNAQFFMVDTNQNVGVGSKQYEWLKDTLEKSTATWKFVCHHHPPYSSDENDYGDLWKSNKSSRGDLRARVLVPLYEDNGVDIVWNGHIHSYERTWRIRRGKAVEKDGPFYMITGGGGGGLETPSPVRPFFQNNVRHGHHYVMVSLNGGTLEMKTFSLEGRMFDYLKITK
tara:strand:+ start:192 stop:2087 length:1896 start_codon:yes stop_codon:yes gene_type:complete